MQPLFCARLPVKKVSCAARRHPVSPAQRKKIFSRAQEAHFACENAGRRRTLEALLEGGQAGRRRIAIQPSIRNSERQHNESGTSHKPNKTICTSSYSIKRPVGANHLSRCQQMELKGTSHKASTPHTVHSTSSTETVRSSSGATSASNHAYAARARSSTALNASTATAVVATSRPNPAWPQRQAALGRRHYIEHTRRQGARRA